MPVRGALGAAVMALGNYIPIVAQSASSLRAILFDFSWVILIAVVLLRLVVYFYKVDRLYPQISEDLKKRRASISNQGDLVLKS